ncbi:MAG TPA: ferritin-like domain-containing protein [Polyangiaceae bacterium]|jgi:hypothetical protein
MASETYHEALDLLSEKTKDYHRAIVSLMEELEAIDWYQQRSEATQDAELRAVLEHNRDEETEHAMMVLEWLRRANPKFDANIRTYLLKTVPITEIEEAEKAEKEAAGGAGESKPAAKSAKSSGSLGVGSLRASVNGSSPSAREEG